MTGIEKACRWSSWVIATLVVAFLLGPLLVTIVVSFTSSSIYTLPPPGMVAALVCCYLKEIGTFGSGCVVGSDCTFVHRFGTGAWHDDGHRSSARPVCWA